ncbi:uncharacterized protein BDV14DRAFT_196109 [Aspergillus stella-maris]|uniref:uncharacterized protein n=1 Tax=Aspergillus stella-maris TaxID=1810926 RepID=UPI003CCD5995
MGCANYHAWLIFNDGTKWIVRIPRTGFSDAPLELVEYLVKSEYATLKFLEGTNVPAPRLFGYGLAFDPSNRVGVGYILMEALPGRPCHAHETNDEQKEKVLGQVADIMIEISKHPFDSRGSLLTASEYMTKIVDSYLDSISDGQIHHSYPRAAYLFYNLLRQNINNLTQPRSKISPQLQTKFYLKHPDDKGDHILIDEEYNITGLIDWQIARVVPAVEAFGQGYLTADMGNLYSSKTGITGDDRVLASSLRGRGNEGLAGFMEGREIMRRV